MSIPRSILCGVVLAAGGGAAVAGPYARWSNGPPDDGRFFPLAVWLQPPAKAPQFRAAGINTYVGLWKGPTEEQVAALKQAGMRLVCEQNETGLKHRDDPVIIGWMHGDEPDNAQALPGGKGYGPPVPPAEILAGYRRMRAADPTRPVLLNLGQGVAWDDYIGRGVRRNHPEDYPHYVRGCDIASFDIYPVAHDRPEVAGRLWFVAQGVERLARWAGPERVVWNCIECTRINQPERKATPHQVRAEAWMAIIHGSRGIIYFVHEWQPRFSESALLDDPAMLAAVTAINRRIALLAPVLNGVAGGEAAGVATAAGGAPVAALVRRHGGETYLFAVAMRGRRTTATFTVGGLPGERVAEVLDEGRSLAVRDGVFADGFGPWDVHLYRVGGGPAR